MKKNPLLASILAGAIAAVLGVVVSHFWTADWPSPPGMLKLVGSWIAIGAVVGRVVFMALVPKKAGDEPSSL